MKYKKQTMDNAVVIYPEGRIDMSCAKEFETLTLKSLEKDKPNVIIDFSQTSYISSAGLRVILTATKKATANKKQLLLCGATGSIKQVLDTSGFSTFLKIYDTINDIVDNA